MTFPAVTGITATIVHLMTCWMICCDVAAVKRLLVWLNRKWGWCYNIEKLFGNKDL